MCMKKKNSKYYSRVVQIIILYHHLNLGPRLFKEIPPPVIENIMMIYIINEIMMM